MRTRVRLQQRILVFLGVCLPVPVFAATGLSIPLPATVERMAAKLVPFADTSVLAQAPVQTRGSIVLTPAERRRAGLFIEAAPASHRVGAKPSPQPLEQPLKAASAQLSPAVPPEQDADPAPIEPPARRNAEPPPAQPVTAPADDDPAPGAEEPKPETVIEPEPEPEDKAKPKPKPKPKPKKPKKPKPDEPEPDEPKAKEPKEPKPKEPKPEPESQPEPETPPVEHGDRAEKDKGRSAGKPSTTEPAADPTE